MRDSQAASQTGSGAQSHSIRAATIALLSVATWLAVLPSAFATTAPHVPTETETDACAICHRAHTAASDTTWSAVTDPGRARSALIVGTFLDSGDTGLCYACHGVDSLGASTDVQTSFVATSAHSLYPAPSAYGPSPKLCSTCHDSHGTDRDGVGEPYVSLLRTASITTPTALYFEGDEYCAACHLDRAQDRWDGIDVWRETAHSAIATSSPGTGIACSACHEPHGSDNPPLILERLTPPSAPATVAVSANDRWLCYGCHAASSATWVGGPVYETGTHGQSVATVAVVGEWASAEQTRTAGECQVCHAPMGRSDGAGGAIPELLELAGRALCETCHTASSIAADTAQLAFPSSEAAALELAVTYDPGALASAYADVKLYARDTTGAPRPIVGPRLYDVPGRAGQLAAGDIDDSGTDELVVTDPGGSRLQVLTDDPLRGLTVGTYAVAEPGAFVEIADVLLDASLQDEIVMVARDGSSPFASRLYVYRLVDSSLSLIVGPVSVGDDASGLACGDVTGTAAADIVVTSIASPAAAGELRIFTEPAAAPSTLTSSGPHPTGRSPRGPAIGDAWDGAETADEIAVANSGETTGTVSVFAGDGSLLDSYDTTGSAGAQAWDTLVADVLPAVSGMETIVALRSQTGVSGVNVFGRLSGGGLGARQDYVTGTGYNSSALAAGDLDRDGDSELVVGNAGRWTRDTGSRRAPSVQVFRSVTGLVLSGTPVTLWGGGAQIAMDGAEAPGVAVANVGSIGRSRHPVEAIEDTHVSTETPAFVRHIECVDCHNVHEATSTVAPAPEVYGALRGTWGVSVQNAPAGAITYTEQRGVRYEYETCFKCHSGWSVTPNSPGDIASQVDTRNASFHAIENSSTPADVAADSFESATPAWTTDSTLFCKDCHGNDDVAEPAGPHGSDSGPLLLGPFWGVTPDATDQLCYRCHRKDVYHTGTADTGSSASNFFSATPAVPKLHELHVYDHGYDCRACHISHGGDVEHLLRPEIGYSHSTAGNGGGQCTNECHSTGTPAQLHEYAR